MDNDAELRPLHLVRNGDYIIRLAFMSMNNA